MKVLILDAHAEIYRDRLSREFPSLNFAAAQDMCALPATVADMSVQISIDLGAPLLFVERVVQDSQGKPVEYVRSWYRGDRYEYSVELDLGDPGTNPYRTLA